MSPQLDSLGVNLPNASAKLVPIEWSISIPLSTALNLDFEVFFSSLFDVDEFGSLLCFFGKLDV